MHLDSTPGPRTGTHPLSVSRDPGEPSFTVPIDVRLHVPADTPILDVVALITRLAEHLNGDWEYHALLSHTPGRFELHDLTLPATQEPQP